MSCRLLILTFLFLGMTLPARADIMIPEPRADRFAAADAIVVGKVIAIEPQDIEVPPFPGSKDKVKYRVAVVNVTEVILGKKGTKALRVGFMPVEVKPIPGLRPRPSFNFALGVGQTGLLSVRKHPVENMYVGSNHFDFMGYHDDKAQPPAGNWGRVYSEELKQARRIAKIVEEPLASLRANGQPERFAAAANLMLHYRTPKGSGAKTEPISFDESKLILSALLSQDWAAAAAPPNAWQIFNLLGLTEKDGWKAPAKINNPNDLRDAVRAWYRDHAEYRIQRYVTGATK
jgi:hypothetical protein